MKLYMSGCISNKDKKLELRNIALFFKAEARLRKYYPEFEIHNPARYCHRGWTWEIYLAHDLKYLVDNRPVMYMLNGWELSRGALLEWEFARVLGLNVLYEAEVMRGHTNL